MKRNAKAMWKGTGAEGTGTLTTPSGALSNHPYGAKLRFQNEDGKAGTNPEELLAATFDKLAKAAEKGCPVSKLFKAEITLIKTLK